MRIIAGSRRGKRLTGPPDAATTRPIPDHVKEALFNLLRGHFEGAAVFDAFAGTGSIGLEAVSRGAERLVCVERDRKIAGILKRNAEALGFADRTSIVVADALTSSTLRRCPDPVNLIFCDPPYPLVRDPEGWVRVKRQFASLIRRLAPGGFAVIRTPHPFVFLPESDVEEGRREGRVDRKRSRAGPPIERADDVAAEDEVIEIDLGEISDEELDRLGDGLTKPSDETPKRRPVDADLEVPGAEGPETHSYGSTAIHLYMRAGGDDA